MQNTSISIDLLCCKNLNFFFDPIFFSVSNLICFSLYHSWIYSEWFLTNERIYTKAICNHLLKLNIQKTKIMASSPITLWQIDGVTVESVADFILGGSKITSDGDCSHEKDAYSLGEKLWPT